MSQHLQDRYAELIAGGASPDEATRLTLNERRGENVLAHHLALLRQAHSRPPLTPGEPTGGALIDLWFDVRYAIRQSLKHPSFTAVIVGTLAICLAANVAIFAVVDA